MSFRWAIMMDLPDLQRLSLIEPTGPTEPIVVHKQADPSDGFWIVVGLRLTKQNPRIPDVPFGKNAPLLVLNVWVTTIDVFRGVDDADKVSFVILIGGMQGVEEHELKLVPRETLRRNNALMTLEYDEQRMSVKVREQGMAPNKVRRYRVEAAALASLHSYLAAVQENEAAKFLERLLPVGRWYSK